MRLCTDVPGQKFYHNKGCKLFHLYTSVWKGEVRTGLNGRRRRGSRLSRAVFPIALCRNRTWARMTSLGEAATHITNIVAPWHSATSILDLDLDLHIAWTRIGYFWAEEGYLVLSVCLSPATRDFSSSVSFRMCIAHSCTDRTSVYCSRQKELGEQSLHNYVYKWP